MRNKVVLVASLTDTSNMLDCSFLKKWILISFWCLSGAALKRPYFWIPTKVWDGRRGLSWHLKVFDKGMRWTESYLLPHIAFQWMHSLWETVCPLCRVSGEAYHFTPTCRHWPAHGLQNKTLSVCSSVERCPLWTWPGKGRDASAKVNPHHFPFLMPAHTGI